MVIKASPLNQKNVSNQSDIGHQPSWKLCVSIIRNGIIHYLSPLYCTFVQLQCLTTILSMNSRSTLHPYQKITPSTSPAAKVDTQVPIDRAPLDCVLCGPPSVEVGCPSRFVGGDVVFGSGAPPPSGVGFAGPLLAAEMALLKYVAPLGMVGGPVAEAPMPTKPPSACCGGKYLLIRAPEMGGNETHSWGNAGRRRSKVVKLREGLGGQVHVDDADHPWGDNEDPDPEQ